MTFIIVTRNPSTQKLITIVDNDEGDVSEFKTEEQANDAASQTTVCKAWGYQVLEAD
jgi:hypothetical protein